MDRIWFLEAVNLFENGASASVVILPDGRYSFVFTAKERAYSSITNMLMHANDLFCTYHACYN